MATLQDLANAISNFEGFNVAGSLAQRNNNPGNLKYAGQAGATLGANGFAVFDSLDDGQAALLNQLNLYSSRGMTLAQMMNTYAPSSDNNDTSVYLSYVSQQTGVDPSTSLSMGFQEG